MLPVESEALYRMRKSYRVGVTGLGAVTPVGLDMESTFKALVAGESGIRRISTSSWPYRDDARNSQIDIAGLVMGFDASHLIGKKELRRMHPSAQYALLAIVEGLTQANLWDPHFPLTKENRWVINVKQDRLGGRMGTGVGGGSEIAQIEDILRDKGDEKVSGFSMLRLLACRDISVPSMWIGLQNEIAGTFGACASSSIATTDAYKNIEGGYADVMIAGGTEAAVHRTSIASFNNMWALYKGNEEPEKASCPFDQKAGGFVMAEGSGILVLESLAHAVERNANIFAELIGFGNNADAKDDVLPDKEGQIKAVRLALAMAEIEPWEVDYINAHGTSTPAGGEVELQVFREVFGKWLEGIAISSTKSATGHLLGAAGGLEAAICVKTIQEGVVPPTLNLHNPIPEAAGLNLVALKAQKREVRVAMSTSFGFGGINSVLIFREYPGRYQESFEKAA